MYRVHMRNHFDAAHYLRGYGGSEVLTERDVQGNAWALFGAELDFWPLPL